MKVTKRGRIPEERPWYGVCRNCKSEASAMESEMTNIKECQRDGKHSWEICPVCEAGADGWGGMLFQPARTNLHTGKTVR